ncbi:MAG: nucleotidyltransferase family protein [Kaistella sp.]
MNGQSLNKKIIYSKLQKHNTILEQYGVKRIGLFGSFVPDEGNSQSDIDFLVDFENGKKTFKNSMVLAFYWQGLSPYVGPCIL